MKSKRFIVPLVILLVFMGKGIWNSTPTPTAFIYASYTDVQLVEIDYGEVEVPLGMQAPLENEHTTFFKINTLIEIYNSGASATLHGECQGTDIYILENTSSYSDYNMHFTSLCDVFEKHIPQGKVATYAVSGSFGFEPGEFTFGISADYIDNADQLHLKIISQTDYEITIIRSNF